MRHLFVLCLFLILIPSLCIASQNNETCGVVLFGIDNDARIPGYQAGTIMFSINNIRIPLFKRSDILVFKELTGRKKFKSRFGNSGSNDITVDCSDKDEYFLKIDRWDASFSKLNEEEARAYFKKFESIKYLSAVGDKYVVKMQNQINGHVDFAKLFDNSTSNLADINVVKPKQISVVSRKPQLFTKTKEVVNRHTVAVIIGNKNYSRGAPNVDYAHNDADQIKKYVVQSLGYREGNIIDLRDATQADLISVFGNKGTYKGKLFNWLRANESDVFFYYSGHGAPGLSTGQSYLLPIDADPNTVELNGYPLETLYANISQLPARSVTVVIDACFSGASQAGSVVKKASSISLKRVDTKAVIPNATILTAAGVSEVASWDEDAQLGLFTRHFLEGLTGKADENNFGNGDGQVTLGEVKNYLESEVTYMARRLYNREQHPQVIGSPEKVMAIAN